MTCSAATRKTGRLLSSALLAITGAVALTGCQLGDKSAAWGPQGAGPIRAIWVTRWDYKSQRDITEIMDNCRSAGFNTVLFQVRGNGTVAYRSRIEPWAKEFGGRDPGFDPLAVACGEAHKRGLDLHAWVNVMPGWRGKQPPSHPRQLYNARPDWFWRDASGRRQPLGWYNSLNPCYPEVRRYLSNVMREIAGRYPVDGIHMDYIRFPNEWNNSYPQGAKVPDYPRDRRTLAMFRKERGKTPNSDPAAWDAWRAEKVTQLVKDIRAAVRREKAGIVLSAAVSADPDRAKRAYFQDSRGWIAQNLLDAVYPMNYDADLAGFGQKLARWSEMRCRIPVVTGIMFDKRDSRSVNEQVNRSARTGSHFAAFAYNSLFERRDAAGQITRDAQSASRAELRRAVIPHVRRLAAAAQRHAAR